MAMRASSDGDAHDVDGQKEKESRFYESGDGFMLK